jgi:hypothetical protein
VNAPETLGRQFNALEWIAPDGHEMRSLIGDAMDALLLRRAEELAGFI